MAATLAADVLYFTVPQIAKVMGWEVQRTRRWLHRAKVLEKRHGTLVTTAERLASEFPETYRRLLDLDDA